MRLTVAGCRAGTPADGQASSGYLVEVSGGKVLLDCGPGVATTLGAIARPRELDAVVITHVHLDHCYDLLPIGKTLLSERMRYPGPGEPPQRDIDVEPVPLYLPKGTRDTFHRLGALFPVATVPALDRAFELAFDIREYEPGEEIRVGAMEIALRLLRHSSPNCGVGVTADGATLAYTGDTGPTEELLPFARGADLLLAECTLEATDHGPHGHLCPTDSAEVARAAGVGGLVLTHFPSADPEWLAARRDQAAAVFDGPVHIAEPCASFEVGYSSNVATTGR